MADHHDHHDHHDLHDHHDHHGHHDHHSQVADQYAFIPREAVSRFLLHCTECQRKPTGMVVNNSFDIKSELSSEPSEFEAKPSTPQLATPPATPPSEAAFSSLPYMLPPHHGPIGPHAAMAYAQVKRNRNLTACLICHGGITMSNIKCYFVPSLRRSMLCSPLQQGASTQLTQPFLIQVSEVLDSGGVVGIMV